jgi:hypothetical protein
MEITMIPCKGIENNTNIMEIIQNPCFQTTAEVPIIIHMKHTIIRLRTQICIMSSRIDIVGSCRWRDEADGSSYIVKIVRMDWLENKVCTEHENDMNWNVKKNMIFGTWIWLPNNNM